MGKHCEVVKTLKIVRETVENNWWKGALKNWDNYCLVGAIRKADGEEFGFVTSEMNELPEQYWDAFYTSGAIPEKYDTDPHCRAFRFNDHDGTKKEDVLKAVDTAIAWSCERAMEEEKQNELTLEKADGQ